MENEMLKVMYERRSVKSYKAEQIKEEELQAILKAGTLAPTGHNSQSPVMVVVQNKETIAKMGKINAEIMGAKNDPFYGAPTVVVVFGNPEYNTWMEDASLVAGNLMNAAAAIGVGSCWIHRAHPTFETEVGKQLKKEWGIGEQMIGVANILLGYQKDEAKPRVARKENYIVRVK